MDVFNIASGISSILGLVISIVSLIVSGCTLYKVSKKDSSKTENSVHNASIGGDYVGRDRRG